MPPEKEPLIGTIRMWPANWAPQGWLLCDGSAHSTEDFLGLYNVIGNNFGGDNRNFCVPDLKARFPLGAGPAPGLATYRLSDAGGVDSITLTMETMAPHTHPSSIAPRDPVTVAVQVSNAAATLETSNGHGSTHTPQSNYFANAYNSSYSSVTVDNYDDHPPSLGKLAGLSASFSASGTPNVSPQTQIEDSMVGEGTPFNTTPPYVTINYIICAEGEFPMPG